MEPPDPPNDALPAVPTPERVFQTVPIALESGKAVFVPAPTEFLARRPPQGRRCFLTGSEPPKPSHA